MIPYIGNKTSLSDFILPYCPKNPRYWIEPFGGMMGLFFTLKLEDYPDTRFIYNDLNPLNCDLMTSFKDDEFIDLVVSTDVNEEVFMNSFSNLESENIFERSLSWLIILTCGDVKDLMSKYYRGCGPFYTLKNKITDYREHFKLLKVENLDYKKLLKKYDTRRDVFFYLDPPYKGFEKYYINHNFNSNEHFNLFSLLKSINSKWILSSYKFNELEEWYSQYDIKSKSHNLSEEYIIINNSSLPNQ